MRKVPLLMACTVGMCAIAVRAQPTITLQPTNQTVWSTTLPAFTVAASGTGPLTYQWQFDGTNLPLAMISTVAGTGGRNFSGDGGLATNATIWNPAGVAFDMTGNLFIADKMNSRIRKVDTNGIMTTVAGNLGAGFNGDGGPATNAIINNPYSVTLDATGRLFIADVNNNRIRRVDTNGIITTFAGGGHNVSNYGDGGVATNALLNYPAAVAIDSAGNVFIADQYNDRIRKVDINGIITTVAGGQDPPLGDGGPATNAYLGEPDGVAFDAAGNLLIAEQSDNRIRKIDTNGIITTVAGSGPAGYSGDGGPATNAMLNGPGGIAVDAFGNLFIADTGNSYIRKVDPSGIITKFAGSGGRGYQGDYAVASSSLVGINPTGVAVDALGEVFIADNINNRVRKVGINGLPTLRFVAATGTYSVVISDLTGSVTSSIATFIVSHSPLISQVMGNGVGSVRLNLLTSPNQPSRLLVATNLTAPVSWMPLFTNTPPATGFWQFTDTNLGANPSRFYMTATP